MKKNRLYAILPAIALLAACSENHETAVSDVPVDIASRITRASGTQWASGDRIGVFMVDANTSTVSQAARNECYATVSGDGAFTATGSRKIYFPISGNVDFIAYYPYTASAGDFAYAVDVVSQTDPQAIDLLYSNNARGCNKQQPAVNMQFTHRLAKFVVLTTFLDGLTAADLENMTLRIKGMNTTAVFDLKTGSMGTGSTVRDIQTRVAAKGERYEALVLAENLAEGQVSVEFTLNNPPRNDVFGWTVPAIRLDAGDQYEWKITLTRTEVRFTPVTIVDWDDTTIEPVNDDTHS